MKRLSFALKLRGGLLIHGFRRCSILWRCHSSIIGYARVSEEYTEFSISRKPRKNILIRGKRKKRQTNSIGIFTNYFLESKNLLMILHRRPRRHEFWKWKGEIE